MNIVVVGSGPAGVSAATGLIERGFKVHLLDAGNVLEPEKRVLLNAMQQNSDAIHLEPFRQTTKYQKLPYGSRFIYDHVIDFFRWTAKDVHLQHSFAQGGLSHVWGSALAQHSANDLADWPRECRLLDPYYKTVISWLMPYYQADTTQVMNTQSHYLKKHWLDNQARLKQQGITFSPSMLAVHFEKCRLSGTCQYGCPLELIYHTGIQLDWLKTQKNFIYTSQTVLLDFAEKKGRVELKIADKQTKESSQLTADYLFVACGAGLSSLLYLRALKQPNQHLLLKDSQHFLLPGLLNQRARGITKEPLHALSQLNMTIADQAIASHPVHLQFYTYIDLYQQEMQKRLKWLYPMSKPFLARMLERFVVIQGYLNSNDSSQLQIQYDDRTQHCLIKKVNNPVANKIIKKTTHRLSQQRKTLGFKPLRWLLAPSLTGGSNHVGGSLPMAENPTAHQTDIWGSSAQWPRVHFVDGSILSSIPAGPITLTIMANAYRIGKNVPLQ